MSSINELKISVIDLITKISDYNKLVKVYAKVKEEVENETEVIDKFQSGAIQLRKNIGKDQIFEEQDKKPINFEEVQKIVGNIEWEHSVDELLATLD